MKNSFAMDQLKLLRSQNFKTKKIESILIYTSDYTRALETANCFTNKVPQIKFAKIIELRERNKIEENHHKFDIRVRNWFTKNLSILTKENSAVYAHCDTINIILSCLDSQRIKMLYPFLDKYHCLTPSWWDLGVKIYRK